MIKLILTDIEGTTTSIDFVHDTLFPYSYRKLESYIQENQDQAFMQEMLKAVSVEIQKESGKKASIQEVISTFKDWIKQDRKHPILKELQGYIWKEGYESGDFKGHIYADVPDALKKWKQKGLKLGIYSSGSIPAQKLLFGYSDYGNLNPYFEYYFDAAGVGPKREPQSYSNIIKETGFQAFEILFLSDIAAELEAANTVGMQVCQLLREGTLKDHRFVGVKDFSEIEVEVE